MNTQEEAAILRNIKPVIFGEREKKGVSKGEPVLAKNTCIFCEGDVWVSSIGYYGEKSTEDIKISEKEKERKAVHKICFFVLANQVFPAVIANIFNRFSQN